MVKTETYIKHLIKIMPGLLPEQIFQIKKAYEFANKAHYEQIRKSGEPYIIHPIEVSYLVALWNLDYRTIMASLLHDVVEDTDITREDINKLFGEDIGDLVDGVTKISSINSSIDHSKDIENYRKLIFALSKDLRVIIIKFADRIHNLKTLQYMPFEKQKRISRESLEIYAPLAYRLGMNKIKMEIEDLAFKYHKPKMAKLIEDKVKSTKQENEKILNEIISNLIKKLKEINLPFKLKWRTKSSYSIYSKYKKNGDSFEGIYDIRGIRIITDKIENCYKILGLIHQTYTPVTNRFKDYIAIPKNNNYQSIHTTFVNSGGKFIEAQIRTTNMDYVCEYGIAAHILYKEKNDNLSNFDNQISELRKLLNHDEIPMVEAFSHFKKEIFKDEIYVFSPQGTIFFLQDGATVLDFAFHIHTELGYSCRAGIVNENFVSSSHILSKGDRVTILKSNMVKVNSNWLKIAKTHKALSKIKQKLKEKNREEYVQIGKTYIEKYYNNNNFSEKLDTILNNFIKTHNDIIDLYDLKFKVGTDCIKLDSVFSSFKLEATKIIKKPTHTTQKSQILIDGIDNFAYKISKCCMPIPGDEIVGIMTMSDKISIHKKECKELINNPLGIKLVAEWNNIKQKLSSKILISTVDDYLFIKDLSNIVSLLNSFIDEFSCVKKENNLAEWTVNLQVNNLEHLSNLIAEINKNSLVYNVTRI